MDNQLTDKFLKFSEFLGAVRERLSFDFLPVLAVRSVKSSLRYLGAQTQEVGRRSLTTTSCCKVGKWLEVHRRAGVSRFGSAFHRRIHWKLDRWCSGNWNVIEIAIIKILQYNAHKDFQCKKQYVQDQICYQCLELHSKNAGLFVHPHSRKF